MVFDTLNLRHGFQTRAAEMNLVRLVFDMQDKTDL
jgi:hypothetical protein